MATITEKKTLYNGEVSIIFYPVGHKYRKEEEKTYLISPTGVVGLLDKSTPLLIWNDRLIQSYFKNQIQNDNVYTEEEIQKILGEALQQRITKLEEGQSYGKLVHDYAERFAYAKAWGEELPEIDETLPKEVLNGINAFLDWNNKHSVEYLEAERLVYSKEHEYVGHLDTVALVDGEITLVDYKTSSGIYSSMHYQVTAYKLAYNEEMEYLGRPEKKIKNIVILNFKKDTGELVEVEVDEENYQKNIPAFLGLLATKKREKELNKWSK